MSLRSALVSGRPTQLFYENGPQVMRYLRQRKIKHALIDQLQAITDHNAGERQSRKRDERL